MLKSCNRISQTNVATGLRERVPDRLLKLVFPYHRTQTGCCHPFILFKRNQTFLSKNKTKPDQTFFTQSSSERGSTDDADEDVTEMITELDQPQETEASEHSVRVNTQQIITQTATFVSIFLHKI